ncbi:DUF4430 domain-containing protein [Patescibacteria group bacterium]|nr:DUF4430 domain-containing protein [Patescibacteria group bacterium]
MNSFNQTLKIFALLFGVLMLGVFLGLSLENVGYIPGVEDNQASVASSIEHREEIAVDLLIDYGNGDLQSFSAELLFQGDTVLDLLYAMEKRRGIALETRNFLGLGMFIEAIHGVRNTNNFYWQYWVNGKYAEIGAGQYVLQDRDEVLWKRTNQYPNE